MKKKNGFTLVELLACIVIIALIATIAVPSALILSKKVKAKTYQSKINIMEQNAINYGQSNLSSVRRGYNPLRNGNSTCKFNYDTKGNVKRVELKPQTAGFNELKTLETDEYWCFRVTLEELVSVNNLNWDETNVCTTCTQESEKSNYNNIIINPATDYIINKCYMYLYYKNKRVYSYFDVNTCNIQSNTPQDGQEYLRRK